jgi:BirA family biotin operon repressor/biotin-[acetyl-CoA-carboxylase] ligase
VVVGVGLNVNWPSDLPAELAETATALNHVTGRDVERVELLVAFLQRLEQRYDQMVGARSAAGLLDEWRRRSATLGRRVRVDLGSRDVEGTAVDITDEGHLVVETPEGDQQAFAVGDIVHLRPI